MNLLQSLGRSRRDRAPGRGAAGHGDHLHPGRAHERSADRLADAGDDLMRLGWKTGLGEVAADAQKGERAFLRRLGD